MIEKDLVIIGTGGAGMAASIYALRYRIDHVLIGDLPGGTCTTANKIENYPGYTSISGPDLAMKFQEHVEYLGGKLTVDRVSSIQKDGNFFLVTTSQETYRSKTVIYTLGSFHRHLGVPGEKEFEGRGVSYCATCDGAFFRNKTVAVIGGGDSAATGVLVLGNVATKTYMIHRSSELRTEPIWVEQIMANKNVEIVLNTNILEIKGSTKVEKIILDKAVDGSTELVVDGVFIEIGLNPNSKMAQDVGVELDNAGYIKVHEDMSTNIPGFYAAGDVTTGSSYLRQLITAASEGVIATYNIYKYLKGKK
jgi:thioredoxin reductase (NADPH)